MQHKEEKYFCTAMQWSSGDETNNGGTIGISNERPLPTLELDSLHGLWINLRYNKRNPLHHPKRRAIIHNDGPLLHRYRPKLLAYAPSRAEQSNVHVVEAVLCQFLHGVVAVFVTDSFAGGAFGSEQLEGTVGEVSVGNDGEELLADGAGDSDDGDGGAVLFEGHPNG